MKHAGFLMQETPLSWLEALATNMSHGGWVGRYNLFIQLLRISLSVCPVFLFTKSFYAARPIIIIMIIFITTTIIATIIEQWWQWWFQLKKLRVIMILMVIITMNSLTLMIITAIVFMIIIIIIYILQYWLWCWLWTLLLYYWRCSEEGKSQDFLNPPNHIYQV